MVGAACAARLPTRVLIIAEDVEGALELLRSRAARVRVREDSWRTRGFFGKPAYRVVSRLTRNWYRH